MITRLLATIFTFLLLSCAGHKIPFTDPPTPSQASVAPTTAGVMRLVGRFGFGHACPCEGKVLGVAHMTQPRLPQSLIEYGGRYAWSDRLDNYGVVYRQETNTIRDLAVFDVHSGTPEYYRKADTVEAGQVVHWIEYDFSSKDSVFSSKIVEARVVQVISGHIVVDKLPTGGASGSCLFDQNGNVVGVIIWGINTVEGGVGLAAAVYGDWWLE